MLGNLNYVTSSFGKYSKRLVKAEDGAGGLLNLGVYAIQVVSLIEGPVALTSKHVFGQIDTEKVDIFGIMHLVSAKTRYQLEWTN